VSTSGIRHITSADIAYANEFGYTIKLLAVARKGSDGIEARVHPSMVPNSHLLSNVSGAFNAIALESAALGTSLYYGQGAGMMPTASAVVADLMDAARAILAGAPPMVPPYGTPVAQIRRARVLPMSELTHEHYLRFRLADRPGVLAKIANILGAKGISIATVAQRHEESVRGAVPVVMRTHRAKEGALQSALRRVSALKDCRAKPVSIRVEERLGGGGSR